ncbi:MAG: response regulator transcription factor [Chloroflexi bacterium]|nr:response regulator transcription factor [Chloroflexota bacterium]
MIKLFVADDHPVFRKGIVTVLNNYPDFEVVGEAASGPELVKKVTETNPDIILIDIALREVDGIEIIPLVKQKLPEVRVLVITMSEGEDDLSRALKAGAAGYLLKTVEISDLIESVRLVATGDAVLSPSMATKLVEEFRRTSRDKEKDGIARLSPREKEILQLAAVGSTNREIAAKCYISETTVKAHFRNILEKLDAKNRTGAVGVATAKGLLKDV